VGVVSWRTSSVIGLYVDNLICYAGWWSANQL